MSTDSSEKKFPFIPLALIAVLGVAAFVAWPLFAHRDEVALTESGADGIPDGTPEELLAYLEKTTAELRSNPPQSEEKFRKSLRKILQTAEKILEAQPKDADIRRKATETKISALNGLAYYGDDKARPELIAFLEKLQSDKNDDLRKLAEQQLLIAKAGQELNESEAEQIVKQALAYLKRGRLKARLRTGLTVADTLSQGGSHKAAADLYSQIAGLMEKSPDADLRAVADPVRGMARRAALPLGKLEVLKGTTVDGKEFDWKSYRGKVVLVDFWATWCGPCIAELPNVLRNYNKYHDQGFDVVGISLDESKADLERFLKKRDIPWTNLFHDETGRHPMADYYGVEGIPFTILVDRDGKVVATNVRGHELDRQLAKLFDAKPKAAPQTPDGNE